MRGFVRAVFCVGLVVGLGGCSDSGDDCAAGSERCPCYGNGTCNDGLTCASDICVLLGQDASLGDASVDGPNTSNEGCWPTACASDTDCALCGAGLTHCDTASRRCVACDTANGTGCADGETCTAAGVCAPDNATCPTDAVGEPTVACSDDADCAACALDRQVCDTTTQRCRACSGTNLDFCLPTDSCIGGKCAVACPAFCEADSDCAACPGATACNDRRCVECSPTKPCKTGESCQDGACSAPCGLPDHVSGICTTAEDCAFCGDGVTPTAPWSCLLPINGGTYGWCAPNVSECAALYTSDFFPAPYDDVEVTPCSNDGNCASAGSGGAFNVGAMLRERFGASTIELPGKTATIEDVEVGFALSTCAGVEVSGSIGCGLCVPCETNSDCAPIALSDHVDDLFSGASLDAAEAALALRIATGHAAPMLYARCAGVSQKAGVCRPCPNPFAPCGETAFSGGSGQCDHDACSAGDPLDTSCNSCTATVCTIDSYCCEISWDALCVDLAKKQPECVSVCGSSACSHDECSEGAALSPACSPCAATICAFDPYCCKDSWDAVCVEAAERNTSECSACP